MRVLATLLLLLPLTLAPSVGSAVDPAPAPTATEIAAAYAAIPHQRTPFDANASTAAAKQKASLARLFAYTDRGVVLRVQGMKAHGAKDPAGLKRATTGYAGLISELRAEEFPAEVAPAKALIVEAMQLQQRHLQSRPEGGLAFVNPDISRVPEVKEASGKLIKAYGILMRAFPGEPQRNKTSFFDHLCALDFL